MITRGTSLVICDLKADIVNVLNCYNMPAIIKKQVVGEIYNDLSNLTDFEIGNEQKKYNEELEQEEKKKIAQNKMDTKEVQSGQNNAKEVKKGGK